MKRNPLFLLIFAVSAGAADKVTNARLLELASQNLQDAGFRETLLVTAGTEAVQKGTAFIGEGGDFLFAVESPLKPQIVIDDQPGPAMTQLNASNVWVAKSQLRTGHPHTFHYIVEGKRFGGNLNVPAFGPDSYQKAGVPEGKLSEKIVHISKIYEGMESEYWIYAPVQYDASKAAGVMIWTDGQGHTNRNGGSRLMNVIDNLTHQKKIPVIIHIFTSPGTVERVGGTPTANSVNAPARSPRRPLRSVQYDTVSDRFGRFLRDELVAEVATKFNLRKDGYSYAVAGGSSGGIAAFNAAWQMPDQYSRVLSHIGTYTSIQWTPGKIEGGEILPFRVRKDPKRNIRVWLQDGSEDLENSHGSWPLQNIQMANSLKMRGYDFHFTFGAGAHSGAHGNSQLPESLTWLWRDYDPSKTEQTYEQETAEKDKPPYRVRIYNRDAL
ncbi:MAG TPA: alpha/beta hydrolase-fold protein [Bryobacteraceae bacterium]|nr:alpha/beta hydrolase-fold protein [Bryobacteraceae bacterium]